MSTGLQHEAPDLESSTDAYAQRFSGSVGEYFLRVQANCVFDMLPSETDCNVLDVGGGHGQLAGPLSRHGYDVTVMGSDDSCLPRLDRIVGPGKYGFLKGSLLELPAENDSFDVVVAFRMLPHLQNWQRFLGELCRVAKRCVIVDYPDLQSINFFSDHLFAVKRSVEENTRTYRCFRRAEILEAFRENGFVCQASRGQFLFPMALHRLMRLAMVSQSIEAIARACALTKVFGSPVVLKAVPTS